MIKLFSLIFQAAIFFNTAGITKSGKKKTTKLLLKDCKLLLQLHPKKG